MYNISYLKNIDKYVAEIDAEIDHYSFCEDDLFGLSSEGASLISYYGNDALVKMSIKYFGETGKSEKDFYIKNHVIFIESLKTIYSNPIYNEDYEIQSVASDKFYFQDKNIILWIKDNKKINNQQDAFQIKSDEWEKEFIELKNKKTKNNCVKVK